MVTRLLFASILFAFAYCVPSSDPQVLYFSQTLDHFNFETRPRFFTQRYLYLDEYWTGNGPLFFYTGNEGDIWAFYNNSGFVFELAEKFNALVVFAEHRFYGRSRPWGDVNSYSREHIGLLNVEQVLSDYVVLITHLKDTLNAQNIPVITFGGSYGGSLSAYMRMRSPQVVDASLAASAPILLYEGITDSNAFFQIVTEDFRQIDPDCPRRVVSAFNEIQTLGGQGKPGYQTIGNGLRLCAPPNSTHDVDNILYWIRNAFTYISMLDYPYPTNFEAPLPAWPVKVACQYMAEESHSLLGRFANLVGIFYNGTANLKCFNITNEFFQCADASGCGGSRSDPDALSWDYQACTEIIHNIGTNGKTDMFPPSPWSNNWLNSYCQQHWGVNPRPHWMPLNTNLKTSSRIIFSNGELDPWHAGGVLHNLSDSLIAIRIKDAAHHLDLRGDHPGDPQAVTIARQQETQIIGQWLAEIKAERSKKQ